MYISIHVGCERLFASSRMFSFLSSFVVAEPRTHTRLQANNDSIVFKERIVSVCMCNFHFAVMIELDFFSLPESFFFAWHFFPFSLVWCFHSMADNVCLCLNERILNSLFHCLLHHSFDGFMFIRTYYLSWNSFLWPVFSTFPYKVGYL